MPKPPAIEKALAKFDGSPTKLAAAIGGKVLRQHVEHWRSRGNVPTEYVRRVSELTGIGAWEFRADDWHLIWPELIGTKGAPKVLTEQGGR